MRITSSSRRRPMRVTFMRGCAARKGTRRRGVPQTLQLTTAASVPLTGELFLIPIT